MQRRPPSPLPPHRARVPRAWPRVLCALLPALLGLTACGGEREDKPKKQAVLEVVLNAPASEDLAGGMFDTPRLSHREVVAQLRSVATESHLHGLLLRLGSMGGAWARAEDLKRALDAVRTANKPVHCHFEGTDNLGYTILAGHCDELSITPAGLLNLVGLRAQGIYAREALDALGLTAEMLHVGKYKGAADTVTLDAMPDSARETLDDMLDDLHGVLARSVQQRKGIGAEAVQGLLDGGPYTANAALKAGLVDRIAYDDEARQRTRAAAKVEHVTRAPRKPPKEDHGLAEIMAALSGDRDKDSVEGARLGVAYLQGAITRGDPSSRSGAQAESFVRQLRKWADDDGIRAVVLRIHSPGGSALASDLMWQAVRRVVGRKPVIASVGDMAASGGYYVASGATEVFAEEASLVGSIGVVGGKIVAQDLAERVGVHTEILRRGRRAAWLNPLTRFDAGERAAMQGMLESTYRLFVRRVAQGRKLQRAEVETVAQGRLMSGARGKAGKLVDTIGGLDAAMDRARTLSRLPDDAPVEVWPGRQGLLDQIAAAMGQESEDDQASQGSQAHALALRAAGIDRLLPGQLTVWTDLPLLQVLLSPEQGPAALLPYGVDIR